MYRAELESSTLLRRVDTDFVNLTLIADHLHIVNPPVPDAVVITSGSPLVCGTWVPLNVAQELVKDEASLQTFLADDLRSLFPSSIDMLCPPKDSATTRPAFGHQFMSASDARHFSMASHRLELPPREFEEPWDALLTTHPSFLTFPKAAIEGQRSTTEDSPTVPPLPLSATEEEMFHAYFVAPSEGAVENIGDSAAISCRSSIDAADNERERPLRRSKRVADVATRSRTRSTKRGSRTSLS